MIRFLSLLFLLTGLSLLTAYAQFPGAAPGVKGKITGKLQDAETKSAVPYATVTLFKKQPPPRKQQAAVSDKPVPAEQQQAAAKTSPTADKSPWL